MSLPSSRQLILGMRALYPLPYRQQLGVYDSKIKAIRRPNPKKVGYGDCTSVIQHAYLTASNDEVNPGYYTGDMRTRGTRVADSTRGNFSDIRPGDVLLMRWWSGYWHAELAINSTQCIGHGGPGSGPLTKNLRPYLGGAAYWEARRHPLSDHQTTTTTKPKDEGNMTAPQTYRDTRADSDDGLTIKPGQARYLSAAKTPGAGSASNVTREVAGSFDLVLHVYVQGTPGDEIRVRTIRSKRDKKPYPRTVGFWNRIVLDKYGKAQVSIPAKGYRRSLKDYFFWQVSAHSKNKGDVKLTRLVSKSNPIK